VIRASFHQQPAAGGHPAHFLDTPPPPATPSARSGTDAENPGGFGHPAELLPAQRTSASSGGGLLRSNVGAADHVSKLATSMPSARSPASTPGGAL
jgi:hypothetical protein